MIHLRDKKSSFIFVLKMTGIFIHLTWEASWNLRPITTTTNNLAYTYTFCLSIMSHLTLTLTLASDCYRSTIRLRVPSGQVYLYTISQRNNVVTVTHIEMRGRPQRQRSPSQWICNAIHMQCNAYTCTIEWLEMLLIMVVRCTYTIPQRNNVLRVTNIEMQGRPQR